MPYLRGQDLWDIVVERDNKIQANTQEHVGVRKKWSIKCGKTLCSKQSNQRDLIDHI